MLSPQALPPKSRHHESYNEAWRLFELGNDLSARKERGEARRHYDAALAIASGAVGACPEEHDAFVPLLTLAGAICTVLGREDDVRVYEMRAKLAGGTP